MTSCREAIAQTWPADLQAVAIVTMTSENGREDPNRISAKNSNGTYDYGCWQINSIHRAEWEKMGSIFDPVVNAKMALTIFQRRKNWSAWYAVCTPSRQPKKPGIWCK